jgi:hypothetical protein
VLRKADTPEAVRAFLRRDASMTSLVDQPLAPAALDAALGVMEPYRRLVA